MKRRKELSDAIDRLAALVPYGHLLAATDPAKLLGEVADEVERLRRTAPVPSNTEEQETKR